MQGIPMSKQTYDYLANRIRQINEFNKALNQSIKPLRKEKEGSKKAANSISKG